MWGRDAIPTHPDPAGPFPELKDMPMIPRAASLPLVLSLLSAPALAHDAPLPGPRPFDAMRGPCADFAMDITREAGVWAAGPAARLTVGAEAGTAPDFAPGTLAQLALHPHPAVSFTVAPEQDRGSADTFSGHARVTIPTPGLWRVAASNGLWYDVVADGAIVPSAAFEMQTQCAAPFKVVVFDLPAGEVALQVNGSRTPEVELVVLPWADR